jgi:hypothetical protein
MHIYTHSLDQKKPKIKLLPYSILYLLYSILLHTTYFTPYFTYFTPHTLLHTTQLDQKKPKIKLYKDDAGNLKGDARIGSIKKKGPLCSQ